MADAVIDVEMLGSDQVDTGADGGSQGQDVQQQDESQQAQLTPAEKERKGSRDYQKWLNGMKETSPEHKPFINRAKDKPVDPKVAEFLRFVLSSDGQALVERQGDYLPLSPATGFAGPKNNEESFP